MVRISLLSVWSSRTPILWWTTHDAQKFNKDLQYAVVPDGLTVKSEQFIHQIVFNGKPVLP